MEHVKTVIAIVLFSPFAAMADNYCGVPRDFPTYGMAFGEVQGLAKTASPSAVWECGLLKNIYKLTDGHTTEQHFKNVVLLLDGDDYGFVSQGQVDGLTVYAKTDKYGVDHYVALDGLYPRMRLLTKEAIGVTVLTFSDVLLPNGDMARIPVLSRIF